MIRRLLLILLIILAVIIGPLALAFGILRVAGIDVVPLLQSVGGTTGFMQLLIEYYDCLLYTSRWVEPLLFTNGNRGVRISQMTTNIP